MPIINYYDIQPGVPLENQTKTTTPLAANAVWSSVIFFTEGLNKLTGSVFANQIGTLLIEQSNDQVNWDISSSYSVPASDGKGFSEDILSKYTRVKYTNGATPQTTFRLHFLFR